MKKYNAKHQEWYLFNNNERARIASERAELIRVIELLNKQNPNLLKAYKFNKLDYEAIYQILDWVGPPNFRDLTKAQTEKVEKALTKLMKHKTDFLSYFRIVDEGTIHTHQAMKKHMDKQRAMVKAYNNKQNADTEFNAASELLEW